MNENKEPQEKYSLPAVTFSTLILSLASSGLVSLGEVPDPQSGDTCVDLVAAKHTIDVLAMLKEKTVNNLGDEELSLLEEVLYELRMKYVIKAE